MRLEHSTRIALPAVTGPRAASWRAAARRRFGQWLDKGKILIQLRGYQIE
jgi:hypothetical protein